MSLLEDWFQSIKSGNLKEINSIYKNNPDIINTFTTIDDGRNHYQTNAIIEASFQGNRDLVKWLIDNNADVNSVSDGGWRPIHFAAQHGHVTTVNLLVLGGAEVNVNTDNNETPILLALHTYMRDTVKKLMFHGASLIGIDRNFLHMCIQKDVLDMSCLDEENKIYLTDTSYMKADSNGYDIMPRQPEKEIVEIKVSKISKNKLTTVYDSDLKRRRQDLVKKMRRVNEQQGSLPVLIRKVALSDSDIERIITMKEAMTLLDTQDGQIPLTKASDHLITLLELCVCDSDSSEEFIRISGHMMMNILQHNVRRGDSAVVDFWCRIFDKMSNLQIEQYTTKILEMLTYMIQSASDGVINNFKSNKDSFLKTWEYFFENLGFPKCLNAALHILKYVYKHIPETVNQHFHNVIDIMIGWCVHPDSDITALESLRSRSADLHDCWVSDVVNLKKTIVNLQKDVISHCQMLSRIHRLDKDRSQVDDIRLKIRYFCFALTCVTAGISGISDSYNIQTVLDNKVEHPLPNALIVTIIESLCEAIIMSSKQIDFDNLLLQSNMVLIHLLACLDKHESKTTIYSTVLRYVFGTTLPLQSRTLTEGSANINYNTKRLLLSNLDLIYICCKRTTLEPSIVIQIFSPGNWIHACLFYGSTSHKELTRRFLRITDIMVQSPMVTTLYQILLSDLELSINTLLKLSGCVKQVHLVQSNAFKSKTYDSDQAELVVKYNLNMMKLLYQQLKEPVILVPSIPVLLLKYLTFTESKMVDKYPKTSVFILETVNDLNKDSACELIRYNCLFLSVDSLNHEYKKEVYEILKQSMCGYDYEGIRDEKIVNQILNTISDLVFSSQCDDVMIGECTKMIHSAIRTCGDLLTDSVKFKIKEVAMRYTMHPSSDIRLSSFSTCYLLLDNNRPSNVLDEEMKRIQSISLRGRTFRFPLDFSMIIFPWIINASEENTFKSAETMRLYDLVMVDTAMTETNSRHRIAVLYEIVINTCWDCVRQKLKFDPNADSRVTLMTIENMVKSILTSGNSLKNVNDKRFRKLMMTVTTKSAVDQMLSVNLLILLLDTLEKMFYNSYEGCSVGMPAVNKTTENFFVTNRHVCSDWFLKMRLMIVALAQYAGQWHTVIWHGMQLLTHHLARHDISEPTAKTLLPEIEDCIVFTSMALSKLGNWETLVGLGRMAVRIYGSKFDWIDALADKTKGHLESALSKLEEYVRCHHDPERMRQSPELRLLTRKTTGHSSFILCMEEIADCNRLLSNTEDIEKWSKQMLAWKSDSTMTEAHKSSINWSRLACLAKLSKWDDSLDLTCSSLNQTDFTWKYRSVTDHCEDALFTAATDQCVDSLPQLERLANQIASIQSVCDFPVALASHEIILINERIRCLRLANESRPIVVDTKSLSAFSPTLPLAVIGFCNALQKSYRTEECFSNQEYLIKWHRNLANFKKSEAVIDQCFAHFLKVDPKVVTPLNVSRAPVIQMQLERQSIKLLWATDQKKNALSLLTASIKEGLLFETSDVYVHASKCHINTKSLLTLFQWLSGDKSAFSLCAEGDISSNIQFLTDLAEVPWINGLPLVSPQQRSQDRPCQSSLTDVCGQLLILASKSKNQDNNDKSFMTLAQWCLRRSRSLDEEGFGSNDLKQIAAGLEKDDFSPFQVDKITQLFTDTFQTSKMNSDIDWLGPCFDDDIFLDELRSALISVCPDLSDNMVIRAVSLWKNYVSHHFSLHIAASDAYFSFLKDAKPQKSQDKACTKNRTTANLRILFLLGKRSRLLRNSIIAKIRTSPPGSWTNVIPQLFARIKHPDGAVRVSVTELLQRFAVSEGSRNKLIIYPTLVGTINEDNGATSSPCQEIRKVLTGNDSSLVYEVDMFIRELRRITVLWDELWIASLNQCYEELNKKTHQLQLDIERISREEPNGHADIILQLKYNSTIQPALFILEKVRAATNVAPETPRETWFHNTFNAEITSTINAVKSPANIYEFKESWRKVKELQELMITECNDNSKRRIKRGRHQFLSLKLTEVSPSLSKISKSRIPIPGMEDVELLAIDSHISILPTKTKPKKLQFVASNGQKYHYLYKGLEDLRLDERIMQILGIANTMFGKLNERESNKYHITTYNVTPLGPRAGLIQMVENATSMFTLYKRHQIRSKNSTDSSRVRYKSMANVETTEATVVSEEGHPIRPTDMFWQKLRPKLELAKLEPGFDNRDKWPIAILTEVLNELRNETPSDLLSKELWCCSINSQDWFRSSTRFTRSCAVMSMMGNVLGLGDRHLDNLLVDLSSGQMVHIDYNVCFDKGCSLKVPEKVPFRLTDMITDVFGPVGVEGLFKISCENVMEMVQQAQDNILTLMDTFVLDPIVDWSSGVESGHYGSFEGGKFAVNSLKSVVEKRCVEFVIGLNNFQSVLVTVEDELSVTRDSVMAELDTLHGNLRRNLEIYDKITDVTDSCAKKRQMIEHLAQYADKDECGILDQVNHVKTIEARSRNIEFDLEKRLAQMRIAVQEHGDFFTMMLSNSDFISFKLDLKNLQSFFVENVANVEKSMLVLLDLVPEEDGAGYRRLLCRLRELQDNMLLVQDCSAIFDKYRSVLQEMPESYYCDDRCSHVLRLAEGLVHDRSPAALDRDMDEYSSRWVREQSAGERAQFRNEKNHWLSLLSHHEALMVRAQEKAAGQSSEEEIMLLESIWQLTITVDPNIFKVVLLEQYLEMATMASKIDGQLAKIPDQVSLSVDYNETLRKYLQLLHYHDNYFKILSNCMNVFGLYLNVNEAAVVCAMMASLQKVCVGLASFESNFIEIIMPESIKIMKSLSAQEERLLDELQAVVVDGDNILLHFNIALTSSSYDIHNYDAIHAKMVVPLRERVARLTDVTNMAPLDPCRQLRVLIASFYSAINSTYKAVCEFIDCCINSSTPSSWNCLDLVASSGLTISAMWNRCHTLLKDAVFTLSLRTLSNTLEHCRTLSASLDTDTPAEAVQNAVYNMLRHVELYLNFVNRHILAGVGSQCFGKMFCLLLEFAGCNLDAMIPEHAASTLSADYICNSLSAYRKSEYPNAANFYNQLQFRFASYKTLTGFSNEPSLSLRFVARNAALHKTICGLAKNQLVSLAWTHKNIDKDDNDDNEDIDQHHNSSQLSLVTDLARLLDRVPDSLSLIRDALSTLDEVDEGMRALDLGVTLTGVTEALGKASADRGVLLASVRKRLTTVKDALLNLDRFECLRASSVRSAEFDDEIVQFLGDTRDLLQELCQLSGSVDPLEEDIILCKEAHGVDGGRWWVTLTAVLEDELAFGGHQLREQRAVLVEIMGSYDRELRRLKAVLASHYYPLMGQLKPTLRALYSLTRKIRGYVHGQDFQVLNLDQVRTRLARVCRLMELFGRFNGVVDALSANESESDLASLETDPGTDYGGRLGTDYANVAALKCQIVPDLFAALLLLSPGQHGADTVTDEASLLAGLSINNSSVVMVANGEVNNGDVMPRVSPALSEEDVCVEPDLDAYCGDKRYLTNSTGVQRAVEVWRLVESRLGMCTSDQAGSVGQYVDKCIRAASNDDNLARMYEGWTAWV